MRALFALMAALALVLQGLAPTVAMARAQESPPWAAMICTHAGARPASDAPAAPHSPADCCGQCLMAVPAALPAPPPAGA